MFCSHPPAYPVQRTELIFLGGHTHAPASPLLGLTAAGVRQARLRPRLLPSFYLPVRLRRERGDDSADSRVTAPCDVPVIDTEHSTRFLWDP